MNNWSSGKLELLPTDDVEGRFFVRVKESSQEEAKAAFGDCDVITLEAHPEEFAVVTPVMTEAVYKEKAGKLGDSILGMIRVKQ